MIPIPVLTVPVIAIPLANRYRQTVNDMKYLSGLKIAHLITENGKFKNPLLIGADLY